MIFITINYYHDCFYKLSLFSIDNLFQLFFHLTQEPVVHKQQLKRSKQEQLKKTSKLVS